MARSLTWRCTIIQAVLWSILFSMIYAVFTTRLYDMITGELGSTRFWTGIVIAIIVTLLVLRPIGFVLSRLGLTSENATAAETPKLRFAFLSGLAALALVVVPEIMHAVGQRILEAASVGIALQALLIAFQVGLVTAAWIVGSRSGYPLAWLLGLIAGGLTEFALQAFGVQLGASTAINAESAIRIAVIGGFAGAAADRLIPGLPEPRLPIALFLAGLSAAVLPLVTGSGFEASILVLASGWALGLALCPHTART